jgi:hypothetical protein
MPNNQLVLIGQLKAAIRALHSEGKLSYIHFTSLNDQLDDLLIDSVGSKPTLDLLLQDAQQSLINIDVTPLRELLHDQHKGTIRERRKLAIDSGEQEFDISDLYPGYDVIPLSWPTWRKKTVLFQALVDVMKKDPNLEQMIKISENLFLHNEHWAPLEKYPHLKGEPISKLLANQLVKIDQLEQLGQSYAKISNRIKADLNASSHDRTATVERGVFGDTSYTVLRANAEEGLPETLQQPLVMWQGMQRFELLDLWYKNGHLSDIKSALIFTLCGFDPTKERSDFESWLESARQLERSQYQEFHRVIYEERLLYWMSWVCSCKQILGDDIEDLWWPVIQSLVTDRRETETVVAEIVHPEPANQQEPIVTPQPDKTDLPDELPEQGTEVKSPGEKVEAIQEQAPVGESKPDFVPADGADSLVAPEHQQSEEDAFVATTSTWSAYLKPFLQENWLAVVGMGFLLAALFLLSGISGTHAYLTEIMLIVVLAFFGLGFSKISMFIYQRESEGASRRATELFALMCIYTLPFNLLMVLQIQLEYSGWVSSVVAGILVLAYLFGLFPRLLKWISGPFELKLLQPLLYGNAVILLPIINDSIYLQHSIPFIGLAILAMGLKNSARAETSTQRFYFSAYSGQLLLLIVIALAYFRFWPGFGEVGLFIALVAVGVVYLTDNVGSKNVFIGGISLLANLLAIYEPIFLVGTLILAVATWLVMAKHVKESWPYEWIYFHLVAIVVTLHYLLIGEFFTTTFYFTLAIALVSGVLFEAIIHRRSEAAKLRLLSLLSFVYPALPFIFWITGDQVPWWMLALGALSACYNYLRFSFEKTRWLWLVGIVIAALIPLIWISAQGYLFLSVFALIWALSPWIPNSRLPEMTSSALWILLLLPLPFLFIAVPIWTVYWGVGFHIAASLIAARRSLSSLPIYLSLGIAATVGNLIRIELGIFPKSGLATAALSLGLALFAFYLQKSSVWQQRQLADNIFGRSFRQKNFLALPIFHASWLALLLSTASIAREIYVSGFYTLLVVSTSIVLLAMLAIGFLKPYRVVGYLVPIPLLALIVYVMIQLPVELNWIVGISLVIGFHYLLDRKYMEKALLKYVLTRQLRFYANILAAIVPPLSFLAWPQLVSNELMLSAYTLLVVASTHFYSIPVYPKRAAGIALVHIIALAVFIITNIEYLEDFTFWMLLIILAILLAVRTIASLFVRRQNELQSSTIRALAYLEVIPAFLIAVSISVLMYLGISFFYFGPESVSWWQAVAGLFAIFICWTHSTSAVPKWLVSMSLVTIFFEDPVLLLLSGFYLLVVAEYLDLYLRRNVFPSGQSLVICLLLLACGLSQAAWFNTVIVGSGITWAPAMQLFVLFITGLVITTIFQMKKIVSPHRWHNVVAEVLIYSLLPVGFYGYYLLQNSSMLLIVSLAVLSIALIHQVYVSGKSINYAHLAFAHLIVPWLLYSMPDQLIVADYISALPGMLLGVFTILLLVSYSLENNIAFGAYTRPVRPWMTTTATAFLISVMANYPTSFESYYAYLVLPVVHFGFRRFNNLTAYIAKLIASMLTGFAVFSDSLAAAVAGAFLFAAWELLTYALDRVQQLRFRGDDAGRFDFILTLQWGLLGVIALHLVSSILLPTNYLNVLLYTLLPLFYLLHIRRDSEYLAYAFLAVFVYANGFMFYEMRHLFADYALTGLHLTSLSFFFSIAAFYGFRKVLK